MTEPMFDVPTSKETKRGNRLREASCYVQSPPHRWLASRIRCNRPREHEGDHQRIRAADFFVLAAWDDDHFTVDPPKGLFR